MEKYTFTSLHVNNLTINNAYALFKTSIDMAEPVTPFFGPIETAAFTKFKADNESFGKQINKNQKSPLTDSLKTFNKMRIGCIREAKNATSTFIKSPDEVKKAAAQTMDAFLAPYKEADTLPLNSKTVVFAEIIQKYKKSPAVMAAAKTLGIDSTFTLLETKNTECDVIYKQRNEEYAQNEVSGSSLKPIVVSSYGQFSTAIEQSVNLTPSPEVIALFLKLDELRKKYRLLDIDDKETPETPAPEK